MNEKEHHSLADWDYSVPGPYISDAVYVSAPSSLAASKTVTLNREGWAMCKLASALNVYDGRIVNYNRHGAVFSWPIRWAYRAQANPTAPTSPPANCYCYSSTISAVRLSRFVAAVETVLGTYNFIPALSLTTFYQFRATWWQYLQPDMTKLLRHTLEWYTAGAWLKILQIDDSINSWAGSTINKVGFVLRHNNLVGPIAIDNSEIWKRLT